ncbi:MAG: hypothetical protein HZR80_17340 [Candidatus Heimdallarchaeota archaeon]
MRGKNSITVLMIILFLSINSLLVACYDNNRSESAKPNNIMVTYASIFSVKDDYLMISDDVMMGGSQPRDFWILDYSNPNKTEIIGGYLLNSSGYLLSMSTFGDLLFLLCKYDDPYYATGFEIVNISSIDSPEYLGHYVANDSYGWWHDPRYNSLELLRFKDNYVFMYTSLVTSETQQIRIIDCQNMTNITEVNTIASTNRILDFDIKDDIMYINQVESKMEMINISDITNPTKISSWNSTGTISMDIYEDRLYLFNFDERKLDIYSLENATNPEYITTIEKDENTQFFVTNLVFTDEYCFVISEDMVDILDISDLTILNSYKVEDYILEDEYGGFFYGQVGNEKLFVARESNKWGLTLFVIGFSDINNLETWIPYWTPTSPIAITPMIYGIIISTCLLTSMFIKKIAQRKGKTKERKE